MWFSSFSDERELPIDRRSSRTNIEEALRLFWSRYNLDSIGHGSGGRIHHPPSSPSLDLLCQIFDMRWPTYASHLLMKFYVSKSDPNQTFVTVDYAGEVNRDREDSLSITL